VKVRDGLKGNEVGEQQVAETFGVPPGKVADLLALAGDPSDNVPGVPGVGEKTASELIREFGSLEAVLSAAEKLKGARKEKILKGADSARLSLRLVTIDRNVPLPEKVEALAPRPIDASRVAPLFRRLRLPQAARRARLAGAPPPSSRGRRPPEGGLLGARRLPEALSPPSGRVRFPARGGRTTGSAGRARRSPWRGAASTSFGRRRRGRRAGAERPRGDRLPGRREVALPGRLRGGAGRRGGPALFDVQVAGHLLAPEEGTPSFAMLAPATCRRRSWSRRGSRARTGRGRCGGDALPWKELERLLGEAGCLRSSAASTCRCCPSSTDGGEGIRIDPEIFRELSARLARVVEAFERWVAEAAVTEFYINSPKQLAFLLFEKLGLPPVKKTKTGYSTDVEVLEQLKNLHEVPSLVLEYRTLAKIRSTYVDVLPGLVDPRDGRIHTTFHQTQTATGRLSSSDPNLQNIPIRTGLGRRIRSGFVAEPGNILVGADYSQVELRLLAHLSGDAELIRRFRNGDDIHTATAAAVFHVAPGEVTSEQRRKAKVINFGILYGMSPFGLSRELGIGGKEAKEYIDQYFHRYPGVRDYIEDVKASARKNGYVLTIMGRRRFLRDIDSRNRVLREAAERMAVNTPIQGSAADLIKLAMIRVDREFRERGMEARLILQVHDELIVEAPARRRGRRNGSSPARWRGRRSWPSR
jgi:DNA polymerase-1